MEVLCMRLQISKSANASSYYVAKSAYVNKKRRSVIVEKLGNDKYIRETYGVDDAEAWARAYVAELNRKAAEEETSVSVSFSPTAPIPLSEQRSYNAGYLFLQKLFYDLGLDTTCTMIKRRHKFEYDLTSILSRLLYTRIIYPSSKKSSFELSRRFIETPNFELHQIYRALSILASEADYIQSSLYKNSVEHVGRKTGIIYYDCTNYYFEIEEEAGIKQYGHSKEKRPNPIVQMGLFMDREGIPLAFCINPGNTNEQTTLKPLEKKLLTDFGLSKFVVCTDAGLSSTDNRLFNDKDDRAFITVQSLKILKKFQREWALDPSGWRSMDGQDELYDMSRLDEDAHHDTIFFKERWFKENGIEQRMIVTYQVKYREYLRSIRNRQIDRAKAKIARPSTINHKNQQDPARFVARASMTYEGEVAERDVYYINEETIVQEEQFDGFYAVCTSLEEDASAKEIVSINKRRWRIEECFRIMKHEFKARPAFLSRDDRIKAHFMTCFIALILYRFLEKKLGERYTTSEILSCLKDMNMTKLEGYGYIPSYARTDLTDDLHKIFGWDTSKEIVSIAGMRNICKRSKNR